MHFCQQRPEFYNACHGGLFGENWRDFNHRSKRRIVLRILLVLGIFHAVEARVGAFSLLGPLEPWMTPSVGFVHDPSYDVGGPRNLGDEFRWNLPVLTYGFDDEFKRFFGERGVATVEDAIQTFHDLGSLDQLDLNTAPITSRRLFNGTSSGVIDLKSVALGHLLEQLGLANSIRFSWVNTSTSSPINSTEENSWPNGETLTLRHSNRVLLSADFGSHIRWVHFPQAQFRFFQKAIG